MRVLGGLSPIQKKSMPANFIPPLPPERIQNLCKINKNLADYKIKSLSGYQAENFRYRINTCNKSFCLHDDVMMHHKNIKDQKAV